jgi:hypothetical protein
MTIRTRRVLSFAAFGLFALCLTAYTPAALAREINYDGSEARVFVTAGEPTVISFPDEVEGGYRGAHSSIHIERHGKDLIILAQAGLSEEGEVIVVYLKNKRSFILRILPASST